MRVLLELEPALHEDLLGHLLGQPGHQEQAAFLFVTGRKGGGETVFQVADSYKAKPADFASQEGDYLELADGTRAGLIKRAHDLGASVVEMHSHPGPYPAAFSIADRYGLRETVPHMWWRLKASPYLAIVVASSGFDALLWLDNPKVPRPLDGLMVDGTLLEPTNNSLRGWP